MLCKHENKYNVSFHMQIKHHTFKHNENGTTASHTIEFTILIMRSFSWYAILNFTWSQSLMPLWRLFPIWHPFQPEMIPFFVRVQFGNYCTETVWTRWKLFPLKHPDTTVNCVARPPSPRISSMCTRGDLCPPVVSIEPFETNLLRETVPRGSERKLHIFGI